MTSELAEIFEKDFSKKLEKSFKTDSSSQQLALVQLIRTFDTIHFGKEFLNISVNNGLDPLYEHGLHKSIIPFLGSARKTDRYALAKTNDEMSNWAHSVVQQGGRVTLFQLYTDYCKYDLMEFSQLEERKISYRHKDSIVPVEFIEKIEWELYLRSLKVPYAQDIQNFVKQFGSYIKSEMRDRVDVYLDHYIQYKTTPEIDAFFHILASYRCKSLLHAELFNHDLKFGGVKFEKYVEAVTWIISFSLKHAWFCQELLLKRPHLQLMNIVTYMTETNQIIRDLSLCMEIDYKEAEIIFNTMCLDSSNIKSFQASTLPPFVRLSRGIVIRTMKGALANPFSFIMKEVRRKFQYEWDRSVDEREVRFRNEFLELLASIPGIVGAIDPLIIKEGKKVKTDIDAIFFNIKTGSLALIQLKWQDPFGGLSERYSRKSNFILNGNKWVQSVSDWIAEVGPPGVLKATRLDQVKGLKLNTIHLFVVGRYFSDFSGIDERDSRSAWTNWARLTKVVQTNLSNENFLKDPILWMREKFSTQNRVIIKEAYGSSIMKIHDYEIDFPDLDLKKIMEKLT